MGTLESALAQALQQAIWETALEALQARNDELESLNNANLQLALNLQGNDFGVGSIVRYYHDGFVRTFLVQRLEEEGQLALLFEFRAQGTWAEGVQRGLLVPVEWLEQLTLGPVAGAE